MLKFNENNVIHLIKYDALMYFIIYSINYYFYVS